jgi:hypothetical protein
MFGSVEMTLQLREFGDGLGILLKRALYFLLIVQLLPTEIQAAKTD